MQSKSGHEFAHGGEPSQVIVAVQHNFADDFINEERTGRDDADAIQHAGARLTRDHGDDAMNPGGAADETVQHEPQGIVQTSASAML